MTNDKYARVECELAGKKLIFETGHIARQAHGSVLVTCGETSVFAAACMGPEREEEDFFPLTVDYRETTDAAGKIPGGFFKREGRPTTKEILTMRLIDRSIRPLFPEGFRRETQVISRVFGYDGEHPADVLAMIASFAALHVSSLPFHGALGAMRIGKVDGHLKVLPTDTEKRLETDLDLVVAGHQDAIVMVEASARELPEPEVHDALDLAHAQIRRIGEALDELRTQAGKEKDPFSPPLKDTDLEARVADYAARVRKALTTTGKEERHGAVEEVEAACLAELTAGLAD